MKTIKRTLLISCAAGWIVGVTGLTLLFIGAPSGFSVGLFAGGAVVAAVGIVSWSTLSIGGDWLENRGWTFVSWEGNVLKIDVKLFGVTIGTTRIIYGHPITVVQRGERDFYVNL